MTQLEKDKNFFRHQVRVLAEDNGKLWGSWNERKASLKIYRQAHMDITGCSEKEADSVTVVAVSYAAWIFLAPAIREANKQNLFGDWKLSSKKARKS